MSHPEELLAAYVDGSLEEDERALVDGHLAGCETCRVEVGDARRARAALSGLPELDVPPGTVRPALTRRPARDRFRRASWVAGAAAASIAAVVALVLVANQGGGGGAENAGAPRAAAGGSVGREYDRNRINRLAVNLAQDAAEHTASAEGAAQGGGGGGGSRSGTAAGAPTTTSESPLFNSARGTSPAECVRRGAGLTASDRPFRPVFRARFEGTPAYIGAFLRTWPGSPTGTLQIWVIARKSCSLLYYASHRVG